ncbi:MAG: hypothetical protein CML29_14790 [Rhizobiales bacterium]|nr:hypothetical protein [Hyphomicrobiales bacterium]MBA69913.1 hypothetical protein [Hyphomicrobiales bacterium]|tara:strand:+ start:270 stop:713 length:444 start_codon:yes stop_codon:yes gene_type:complete
MIFGTWTGVARILSTGAVAYLSLVRVLRIPGKRRLLELKAFDLAVTVALGSVLVTVILSRSVPRVDGIAALALLIALQFIIAWMSVRVGYFGDLDKSEPRVVFSKGACTRGERRRQILTEDEILAAFRSSGHGRKQTVDAVILETNG